MGGYECPTMLEGLMHNRPIGLRAGLLGLVLMSLSFLHSPGQGQTPAGDGIFYSQKAAFNIPFQTDPGERRIHQVQLYVSQDQGKTWQPWANQPPTERFFKFQARQEGWHWFAVRTIDLNGQAFPAAVEQLQPGIKVCVDTQRPQVVLRSLSPPEGGAGVEWQIVDDHLDLESLRLEQRTPGVSNDWTQLGTNRVAAGQRAWNPGTNAPLEVRLTVRDRAGNTGEAMVQVTPSTGNGSPANPNARPPVGNGAGPGGTRRINSKTISINYELKDVGKYGLSKVELWYTRDPQGQLWEKHDEQNNPQPPYVVKVSEEGLYGFTLVARNRVNQGEKAPERGDQPQLWVEVDLTKPKVQVINVEVGKALDAGFLTVTWTATDKNLGPRPITLSYAESLESPTWLPIAPNEENTGRYRWKMPQEVPHTFYVRVDATDEAKNVGTAHSAQPVQVDLSRPKAIIQDVIPIPPETRP